MIIAFYFLLVTFNVSLFLIIFFLIYGHLKKARRKKIKKLKDFFVSKTFFIKIDSDLSRIKTFAKQNPQLNDFYQKIYDLFEEIHNEFLIGQKQIKDLQNQAKSLKNKNFITLLELTEKIKKEVLRKEKTFFELSKEVTQQDNFLRKEMSIYKGYLRLFLNTYKNKRVLLDKVSLSIEKIINQAIELEKKFKNSIQNGNWKQAYGFLQKYLELVKKIGKIIDKGPTIQTYIYKTIPNKIQQISENYKNKLKETNDSLKNIKFNESVKKIANIFVEVKKDFGNLEVEKTILQIKEMLKAIKILEMIIDSEIQSQKLFLVKFNTLKKEIFKVNKYYQYQNKEVKELVNQGYVFDEFFLKINLEIKELFINLQQEWKKFLELAKANKHPFSTKLFRMKKIVQQSHLLVKKLKMQDEIIYNANSKKIKLKNLYKQIEFAFYDAFYNVKKQNIVITAQKKQQYEKLKTELSSLNEVVFQENISKNTENKLNILLEKVTSFYFEINSKLQLVSIINFLFEEFNPKRAIDNKLNKEFTFAEEQYLKGNYIHSLNAIISFFEKRGTNV